MSHADFVHLRVHSAFSLSEGAIKVKELVKLAADHRMPAVAMTDTGNLFGALEFSVTAAGAGLQPIIGTILSVTHNEARAGNAGRDRHGEPDRLLLLAQDKTGYGNLLHLVSQAFLDSDGTEVPQVPWSALDGYSDGLLALTGGPTGPIDRALADGHQGEAEALLTTLKRLFPDRLYVEIQRHGPGYLDGTPERIEPALIDLAYAHDVPLVATNDVYFADESMAQAHDALLCIADGAYVSEKDRRRVTPQHHFKSAEAMRTVFADLPEAVENTIVVARRCAFMPERHDPILPQFPTADGISEEEELRRKSKEGLEQRIATHVLKPGMDEAEQAELADTYRKQLDYELNVIIEMGFAGYFLIVADFIQWANAKRIPVGPGRGSGAGSVVAWALTITGLDPLRFGLLFERFLNPERVSMPDFDIDFCQDRRDEVIAYVQDRYGHEQVAQIITFGKLQARAVLRDVGRVLQMPYGQVDRICKLVPNNPANPVTLAEALDQVEQLRQERDQDETVAYLIDIALKLEGLYRHASTHAAGVVIGDRKLEELVPLYRDPRSPMPVTQFNMKWVEQAGLVKFDFLGLKTLTVLVAACALVADSGVTIDLETIPLDDAGTYEMLCRQETVGVFQLESAGMRDLIRRLKPHRFEQIIALVALYRPGPMENIPKYLAVANGEEAPDYLHPTLQSILEETYGVMIYQEQVMQVAQTLSGYTLGGADLLRRAMGKKIKAEMDAQRQIFVEGAVGRGVKEAQASRIFDQVARFAGYGFNKAHSAGYALVAYQTAYMKANHPVEFMAATMTLDLGNTDKIKVFRQELQRMGHPLLPPDINRSKPVFAVERDSDGNKAIRYALGAIKGVGLEAMRALVAERETGGPFKSVADVARRLDSRVVNKRQLENLMRAGAFDSLDTNRRRLFEGADTLVRYAHAAAAERDSGQDNLFGGAGDADKAPPLRLPDVGDWPPMERLRQEQEAVGFFLSAHPLDSYSLSRLGVITSTDLQQRQGRAGTVRMAGIQVAKRELRTKRGQAMAFLTLSDPRGVYELAVFPETLSAARDLLESGKPLLVDVEVQPTSDGGCRLGAQRIADLDAVMAQTDGNIEVILEDARAVAPLKSLLERVGHGRVGVQVTAMLDGGGEALIQLPGRWAVNTDARAAIKSEPGVAVVREL